MEEYLGKHTQMLHLLLTDFQKAILCDLAVQGGVKAKVNAFMVMWTEKLLKDYTQRFLWLQQHTKTSFLCYKVPHDPSRSQHGYEVRIETRMCFSLNPKVAPRGHKWLRRKPELEKQSIMVGKINPSPWK